MDFIEREIEKLKSLSNPELLMQQRFQKSMPMNNGPVIMKTVIIPTDGWIQDYTHMDHPYRYNLGFPDVTEMMIPNLMFDTETLTSISKCGLVMNHIQTFNKVVSIWASDMPKFQLSGILMLTGCRPMT